jgi:hypothetical protein
VPTTTWNDATVTNSDEQPRTLFLLNVTHHPYDDKDDVKEDSLITKDAEVRGRGMYLYRPQQEIRKELRELQGA